MTAAAVRRDAARSGAMSARPAVVPRFLRQRVFRGTQAISVGLLTPDQLRGPAYVRLFRDVYVNSADPIDHRVRVEAAALLLPPGAAIGGRSSLCLTGIPEVVEHDPPVEVVVPPGQRLGPIRGIRVRTAPLPAHEVVRASIPRTTPIRTCLDIAREPDLVEAVVALDIALARGRVSAQVLVEAAHHLTAVPGARRARLATGLADGRAESPQESRLRVTLALAGLRPVPQYEVRDGSGGFVARVDLAFVAQRIAVEYEGSWHWEPGQLRRDRQRLDRLTAAGWRVTHVTASDLREPTRLVARIRALLAAQFGGEFGGFGVIAPTMTPTTPN